MGKNKHVAMARLTRKRLAQAPPAPSPQSIGAFARISKTSALHDPSVDKGLVVADAVASRKRKATSIAVEIPSRLTRRTISFPPSSDEDEAVKVPPKRACPRPDSQVPPPAPVRSILVGKRLAKTAASNASSVHKPSESTVTMSQRRTQSKLDGTPQGNCANQKDDSNHEPLPSHLAELVRLNKAFLKIVALNLGYTRGSAPIGVQDIIPDLTRTWGKRQVTVEDIRRCIAIQTYSDTHDTPSTIIMCDYGRGKVCVELATDRNGFINEERLNRQFRENLDAFGVERATDEMADIGATLEGLSLDDLPMATITDRGAGAKSNPMLVKGQRALSELKSDREAKLQDRKAKKQEPMLNPDGTKMGLIDRLRLKTLAKTNKPLDPNGPEFLRRVTLNRVQDVASILHMLGLYDPLLSPRHSFTMQHVGKSLEDSLVPICKPDAIDCVRLIATEVAPEWLKLMTVNGEELVVFERSGEPLPRVLGERVEKLLAQI